MTPAVILTAASVLIGWYFYHVTYRRDKLDFWESCRYYYAYNDKFTVLDPPVRQEKRFDVPRMLDVISRNTVKPVGLDDYDIGGKNTGIFEKWNSDHEVLGTMCNWLITCIQYYMRSENDDGIRQKCMDVVNDFIPRYNRAMQGKFKNVFPWGKNWYQFSISSTFMLFHYVLVADPVGRKLAVDLILNIIETPCKSLGMKREQANSIYMGLPWIVAHYFLGDYEQAAQHPDYKYVVDYIKFPMVTKRKAEGLYIDSTYITHTNCLAYGYLSEMTKMSIPIVSFDNLMRNFMLDWQRCKRVLAHPKIKYGPIGFYTRAKRLDSFTNDDSQLGVQVIPTCLFIRMYGDDYSFACRGQTEWIAYYEADKSDDDMAQYWVMHRGVFFAGQEYEPTFPAVGFAYPKYTDSTEAKLVDSRCRIPTKTSTTTTFVTAKIKRKPLKYGFVFAYNTIGIMRHFYDCEEMRYVRGDEMEHGRFTADELVVCNYESHTIDVYLRIQKSSAYDMILIGDKPHLWSKNQSSLGIFHLHWECKKRAVTSDFKLLDNVTGVIEANYPKGITVVDTSDTVMLVENDKPKIAMYPDGWEALNASFKTKYKDEELEFVYERSTNQYWLAGLCIDK